MGHDAAGHLTWPARRLLRPVDDGWELRLTARERRALAELADLVERMMDEEPEAAPLAPLFRAAYPDDIEYEAEWQVFRAGDLLDARKAQLAFLRALQAVNQLDDEGLTRWIQALNGLRLVIGTSLGVSEDEPLRLRPADPRATIVQLYLLLEQLLGITLVVTQL